MKAKLTKLLAPVTITINASAEGEAASIPTFESVAYSGGLVPAYTLSGAFLDAPYVLDLSGMNIKGKIGVNLDHRDTQRVGHVVDIAKSDGKLSLSGVISAATQYANEVVGSAKNGYSWEVSIEASPSMPKKIEAGETVTVNGQQFTGPLYVFKKSRLTGLAFVTQGADEGNSVNVAASAAGASTMSKFEEFVVSLGADPEAITDQQRSSYQELFDLKTASGKAPATTSAGRKTFKELADETRKENARQDIVAKMGRDAMREYPLYADQVEALTQEALDDPSIDAEKFELRLMRGLRSVKGNFGISGAKTERDPKVLQAALAMATGLRDIEKHYSEQVLDAVDRAGMNRGFSIQQVLLAEANRNGYSCRVGEKVHVGNIRTVLQYAFPPKANMAFSTAALPNILGEVANKHILQGYMEDDQTWREIATVRPVSNFYTQNFYRMLDSLEYEEVGSGGEIRHGSLAEETYTAQAKTYGKMLGITRNQIINDDLGAFNDIRERLGRGAAKKFGNVFWTAFMDNSAFFTSTLTNYISGSTTNLGTDGVGIGLGVAAFRQMTTPATDGSKRVGAGLNPNKVIVPPELESNALITYRNENLNMVANSSANIFQGRFRPVIQWRLSNSSYTGYSTTAWYMFGDSISPMVVTFLNGQETPTVESTDADFDTLGIQFRGYHDFGCAKSEYLAGIKSKGAA